MREIAQSTDIPGIGRNKLYRILKEMDIVDQRNCPNQKWVNAGLLTKPVAKYGDTRMIWRNVTLAIGFQGFSFVEQVAKEYLETHDMPTFPRKSQSCSHKNVDWYFDYTEKK